MCVFTGAKQEQWLLLRPRSKKKLHFALYQSIKEKKGSDVKKGGNGYSRYLNLTVLRYIYPSVVKPICGSATAMASNFSCLRGNCRASHSTDVREGYECFDVSPWAWGVIFACWQSRAIGGSPPWRRLNLLLMVQLLLRPHCFSQCQKTGLFFLAGWSLLLHIFQFFT